MEITREFLKQLIPFVPGNLVIYQIVDSCLKTLYYSKGVPGLSGMNHEEYWDVVCSDAVDIVLESDRKFVQDELTKAMQAHRDMDCVYRIIHVDKSFVWIHAKARHIGEMDGYPVLVATFLDTSLETAVHLNLLDHSNNIIYVIDEETHELLYVNQPARDVWHYEQSPTDYVGKTCYAFIHYMGQPCPWCTFLGPDQEVIHKKDIFFKRSNMWFQADCNSISWYGRQAKVIYAVDITERKQQQFMLESKNNALKIAEIKASHNHQLFEAAVEEAGIVVWEYDIQAHRIVMGDTAYTFREGKSLGMISIQENVPQSLLPFIEEKSIPDFLKMYADVAAGKSHVTCEIWLKSDVGQEPRCERISYTVITDSLGNPVKAYGMGQNVTAQKIAEDRYRKELDYMNSKNPVNLIAKGHHNLSRNKIGVHYMHNFARALEIPVEYTYDDAARDMISMIIGKEKQEQFAAMIERESLIRQFHEGTTHFTMEYERQKNGHFAGWMQTDVNTFKAPYSEDIECFVYTYDLSEQVLERQVLAKLLVLGYDFLSIIDVSTGTYTYIRRAGRRNESVFGGQESYDDSTAAEIERYVDPDQRNRVRSESLLATVKTALGYYELHTIMYTIRLADGTLRQRCGQYCYTDETQRAIFYCRSDVTEQYENEQQQLAQLKDAKEAAVKANEAKSAFLSNISHDMRTPLNGIIGFSDLALRTSDPKKGLDYLHKIKTSGMLLLDLVNDTLELSKIESGTLELVPEAVVFSDIIKDVVIPIKVAADAKQQHFQIHTDLQPFPRILVDRVQLTKIFLNLLSNAVKYTHAGGKIELIVEPIELAGPDAGCRIIVKDNGIGISDEFMSHIYDPFAQENDYQAGTSMGTGLGLPIVKRIVDIMKGTIEVQSQKGQGTCFTVHLPVKPVASSIVTDDDDQKIENREMQGMKILLCEDNPLNAEITQTLLEEQGIVVTHAVNGWEGVQLYESSAIQEYDAILMDLRMPIMDGIEASKAIRTLARPDAAVIPIIAITADAYKEDAERCRAAGMTGYVAKPIAPTKLYDALRRQ